LGDIDIYNRRNSDLFGCFCAINNKEVVVTFTKAVDQATAENAANYTLSNAVLGTVTPVLSADGKSVTLTVQYAAAQQATTDVTVKNVKDTAGTVVADTTKTITFFDVTAPTVTNVSLTGPKTLTVNFSEPLKATPTFVLDGGSYSVSPQLATDGKSATVTLGSTLPAGGHNLEVSAGLDNANYAIVKTSVPFTYTVDTVAPTVAISKVAQNKVTLSFSKDIDPATQSNLSVYHTYNNVSGYVGSVSWTDNKTAVVTFAQNYLPVGNATLFVNTGTAPNVVKDTWGNAFASTSLNTGVTADTTAPTVTGVKVVDANTIDVTYSESVSGALTAANYTLKNPDGTKVNVTNVSDQGNNVYRLTTDQLTGGNYSLAIANVKDTSVAQNALGSYSTTVNVADLVKPTVDTGIFSTDKKKVVIGFSEKMATSGTGSVLDKANYQVSIDGNNFVELSSITGASVTIGTDGKSVVIDLNGVQSGLTDSSSKVRVARVADLAGNTTSKFSTDVTLHTDAIAQGNISEVKAVAQNKVQFKVNTALSAINVNDFKLDSNVGSVTGATYVNSGNTSVVPFKKSIRGVF
jgi:hypothetical protein